MDQNIKTGDCYAKPGNYGDSRDCCIGMQKC